MELSWGDCHTALLGRIRDVLGRSLPPDLMVRAEEEVLLGGDEAWETDDPQRFRIDVSVSERWKSGLPPQWQPGQDEEVQVAEPLVIEFLPTEDVQRWLEVRDGRGVIITAIEVLSPGNKLSKRKEYEARRERFREASVNVVEIDLLRAGGTGVLAPAYACRDDEGHQTPYVICVERAHRRGRLEVYPCPLRKRLPAFRIPLRRTDRDLVLDLQPLIDDIYTTGRYYMLDHEPMLRPAFKPDDAEWVKERLVAAGLLDG